MKERIVVSNYRVLGDLDLPFDFANQWLVFRNVTFEGRVNCAGLCARGLEFYDCRFERGVNLSGIDIKHDCVAYKTVFNAADPKEPSLTLDGASIGGNLSIIACSARGGVAAVNLRVTGDTSFAGLSVHGLASRPRSSLFWNLRDARDTLHRLQTYTVLMALRLNGSVFHGDLVLGALFDEQVKGLSSRGMLPANFPQMTFLGGAVDLSNTHIEGSLDVRGLIITNWLSLQSSKIDGSINGEAQWTTGQGTTSKLLVRLVVGGVCHFYGARIGGNLQILCASLGGGLNLTFAKIDGYLFGRHGQDDMPHLFLGEGDDEESLMLSGLECLGLEFEGLECEGLIKGITGRLGRIRFNPLVKLDGTIQGCRMAGIILQSVEVKQGAFFVAINIESASRLQNQIRQSKSGSKFSMENCSVGGDLIVGSETLSERVLDNLASRGNQADGTEPERRIRELTQLYAADDQIGEGRHPAVIGNGLDLTGTTVGRDLRLSNVHVTAGDIVLNAVRIEGNLRVSRFSTDGGASPLRRYETRCATMSLNQLRCNGDADLSGLNAAGDVDGRNIKITGDLILGPEGAQIRGDVSLRGASASHLVIAGTNFGSDAASRGTLDLSDGEYRKVTVLSANRIPSRTPAALACHNVNVTRWEIVPGVVDFLNNTEPVTGGAYVSVEKYLREAGEFDTADKVFEHMRARATTPALLRWPLRFIGYGTNPWRVGGLILVAFLISWALFLDDRNVTASPGFLSVLQSDSTENQELRDAAPRTTAPPVLNAAPQNPPQEQAAGPALATAVGPRSPFWRTISAGQVTTQTGSPFQWGAMDGAFLALRYHVPIASLFLDELWEPSRAELPVVHMRAINWARLMSYLNWVAWPVFLITLTNHIFRRRL